MENRELIVVEQLPIIKEKLKDISTEIDKKVENAKSLICTEENIKTVKEARAKLNNTFKALEEQRKNVKNIVMKPYNDFETLYKECITDKFKSADMDLKNKIDIIENEIKNQKENEVKEYFEEYKQSKKIDFIKYEQARINVTLTASKKNLKEQAKNFIDQVSKDLELIETQEHKEEILVEYKNTLNVSLAITTVVNRFKAIEEEKKRQEQKVVHIEMNENHEITKRTYEELENVMNKPLEQPKEEKQKDILTVNFKVRGTRTKLKLLKEFLENGGYDYE